MAPSDKEKFVANTSQAMNYLTAARADLVYALNTDWEDYLLLQEEFDIAVDSLIAVVRRISDRIGYPPAT